MAIRKHNTFGIPWYDHDKNQLLKTIEWSFKHKLGPKKLPHEVGVEKNFSDLLGIVSPHAGYSCSGPFASHGYLEVSTHEDINSVIILGTNHTGMGSLTSLFPKGEWQTPLGTLQIDEELHDLFTDGVEKLDTNIGFSVEPEAHYDEHSIDNQLPFLQYTIKKEFTILPIVMGDHSLQTCLAIAEILADIRNRKGKKLLLVASSDFTHYLSPYEAEKKDKPVLQYLQEFNLELAVKTQNSLHATICGFGPIVSLFAVGKKVKLANSKLLAYGHSGKTCGDNSKVVAYSSIIVGN